MQPFPHRSDLGLLAAAVLCGFLFFASLSNTWPLAAMDLHVDRERLVSEATRFLEARGFELDGYVAAPRVWVDAPALEYVERTFGNERVQQLVAGGGALYRHRLYLKKRGEPNFYRVEIHPRHGVTAFRLFMEEDDPGARVTLDRAREIARDAVGEAVDINGGGWEETAAATNARPERTDHEFIYERELSREPELRERLLLTVAGDRLTSLSVMLVVPGAAAREARAAEAPAHALEGIGFAGLALSAVAAFFVFLTRLQRGTIRLGRALVLPGIIFACLLGTYLLQDSLLLLNWEPLWPRWLSTARYLLFRTMTETWMLVVLLAVIAAGDALDRELGAGRGDSLWKLVRGRVFDPGVGAASLRGFMIGMLCGATLAASVWVLQRTVGATTVIQPRGFFFYAINSASPAASTLLFFFNVALIEELGYRFFGGSWLQRFGGRRWLAILAPALIYGLTHTRLDFLPPATPWWGRALVLTLVGVVWGWAFFRYDALTVVLSHYTADLFIFNWPRLGSGQPGPTAVAALTLAVPLLPGLWMLVARPWRRTPPGPALPG